MLTQVIDLGVLKFGKPHNFDMVVKNNENFPITIDRISLGCNSCTKAKMLKNVIGAGEEGIVNVEFTPGVLGPQRKSISLIYNENSLKMEFIANVES